MSGWNPQKVAAFRVAFEAFLANVRINSKERGGNYCPADGLYLGQRRFLDTVFEGLSSDVHDFKCLKSRQLGLTTVTRILSIFWLGMHEGLLGAMVFDTDSHKENARREIESIISGLPPKIKFPRVQVKNRYGLILENGSKLEFMAAGVKQSKAGGSLARGSGYNFMHASEVSGWSNPEGLASLKETLAQDFENRLYVWESTARGFNDWYDIWEEAKLDKANQRALFLGFWSKDNQIIPRDHPEFVHYGLTPPTEEEQQKIDLVRARYDWQITQEQLAWYRRKFDPTRSRDDDDPADDFLGQEQCWVEEDAFIQSGSSFFPTDILTELSTSKASREKPKHYKYFCGQDFISCEIFSARTFRETQLKVWEEPEFDTTYVVSADPAFGHNENNNNSAIQILKCYADKIEQVAEFAHSQTPSHHFAWICASLIAHYSMGGKNTVLFILELNGPGEAVWNEYRSLERVVRNGYLRKEARERGLSDVFNNVRQYIYTRSDSMGVGSCWHWKTTGQLKESIFERLRDAMMTATLLIRSQEAVGEMKSIVRDGGSIGAPGNKRDDRTFALAMGVRAWEEKLRGGLIAQKKTRENEIARKRINPMAAYNMYSQHMIDNVFKVKQKERLAARAAARRAGWRYQ